MGNIPLNFSCLCPDNNDDIEVIKKSISKIESNHLFHIEQDIKKNTDNINEIKLDIRDIKLLLSSFRV